MKKRIEPKYKFLGILLLFVIGIIAITAAPVGTKPIPGHNGSQIQPGTILGDRMADNLNLTGNVSINDVLNVKGSNVGIGTTNPGTKLEVNGSINITGTINGRTIADLSPTGTINMWATTTAPAGWVLCDGASLNRTIYAALFAVLGITYGNVSATHFNVPNLKGNVPVGLNSADTSFDVLGEIGGEKTHTLTIAEMPAHTHKVGSAALATASGSTERKPSGDWDLTTSTGGDGPHNNLQPYITLNYIIKY